MNKLVVTSVAITLLAGSCFAQESGVDKDNTGINKRDTENKTLTPEDQSSDPADVKITQVIRQAIVKDESLSMTAKNIKIITVKGVVTLRGPVKSQSERDTVAKLAIAASPNTIITNQTEIEKE